MPIRKNFKNLEVELNFLSKFEVIFWDFDGVIKESLQVKSKAYAALFNAHGIEVKHKVIEHHLQHGGMSRYEKIPFYFKEYAHRQLSEEEEQENQLKFENLVVEKVIESEWVLGVKDYLLSNSEIQYFFLLTGTPQQEIEYILEKLSIHSCFKAILGAPLKKKIGLKNLLNEYKFSPKMCLMIGDSKNDYEAAKAVNIPFLLRMTPENQKFADTVKVWRIRNFEKTPI